VIKENEKRGENKKQEKTPGVSIGRGNEAFGCHGEMGTMGLCPFALKKANKGEAG